MKMKQSISRRIALCLMIMSLVIVFTACGSVKAVRDTLASISGGNAGDAVTDETENDDEDVTAAEGEEGDSEEGEQAEGEEDEPDAEVPDDAPVFGQEDIAGYDGFSYLTYETLQIDEETGKEAALYAPASDYISKMSGRLYSSRMGVYFTVDFSPYIRWDGSEKDYLPEENLDFYLENSYDPFYYTDYKDMEISEAEGLDDTSARATLEYCQYRSYDKDYDTIFTTFYLKEIDSTTTVLIEIEVHASEVTGKTTQLLEELEAFYQFDIDWDADRASDKIEAYLASGGDHTFSTGYIMFELPEGWDEDNSYGYSYDSDIYAPDGNADAAGCMIIISREYMGYDFPSANELNRYQEDLVELVDDKLGEESSVKAKASYYGMTSLGATVFVEGTMESDGEKADMHIYYCFNGSYAYEIMAVKDPGVEEDCFAVAEDIILNGQVRD